MAICTYIQPSQLPFTVTLKSASQLHFFVPSWSMRGYNVNPIDQRGYALRCGSIPMEIDHLNLSLLSSKWNEFAQIFLWCQRVWAWWFNPVIPCGKNAASRHELLGFTVTIVGTVQTVFYRCGVERSQPTRHFVLIISTLVVEKHFQRLKCQGDWNDARIYCNVQLGCTHD
jgi:hypothetical protein